MRNDCSIIIVNYKTCDHLKRCLLSIAAQEHVTYEVIVIDNNSNDGSLEMLNLEFKSVKYIANTVNEGFARANNIGLAIANGKYALILNPDTELSPGMLYTMHVLMENDPSISAAGCKILYSDGSDQLSCGRLPNMVSAITGGETLNSIFRKFFPFFDLPGSIAITSDKLGKRHDVEVLLGACFIVRMDVLQRVGFFDENMFMYFEECELFQRIKKNGGRIVFTPETSIIHYSGGSLEKSNFTVTVSYYLESQEYYLIKVFSMKGIRLFRIALTLVSALKFALFMIIRYVAPKNDKHKFRRRADWQKAILKHYMAARFARLLPRIISRESAVS